jgi:hypothetical protein
MKSILGTQTSNTDGKRGQTMQWPHEKDKKTSNDPQTTTQRTEN